VGFLEEDDDEVDFFELLLLLPLLLLPLPLVLLRMVLGVSFLMDNTPSPCCCVLEGFLARLREEEEVAEEEALRLLLAELLLPRLEDEVDEFCVMFVMMAGLRWWW